MNEEAKNRIDNLRLEYKLTQDMAIHYDTINWAIGAILIAGIFNGLRFISRDNYILLSVISFVILVIWRLFYKRHKNIQSLKFRRLQRIEKLLHLRQHRLIKKADDKQILCGIKGDCLATIITLAIPVGIYLFGFIAFK